MADHTTTDTVSRRNVLKATGGLLGGATVLAGLGTGRGTALEEGIRMEVMEINHEEFVTVEVRHPEDVEFGGNPPTLVGPADRFVIHDDAVSLPEDTNGLAKPVEMERLDEQTYRMYFPTRDIDFSEVEGEAVTLGLGVFPERTVPVQYFDTDEVRSAPGG